MGFRWILGQKAQHLRDLPARSRVERNACAKFLAPAGTVFDATAIMDALPELLFQHEQLRALMARCERLADDFDVGRGSPELLAAEVARLRVAFDHHNHFEERELRPLLRADTSEVESEQRLLEHVAEHRAMGARFTSSATRELRETLAMLHDHLATEERSLTRTR